MNNYQGPYGYPQQPLQPPQYPQYPYDPRLEKYQALETRINGMESRLFGNANNPWQGQENSSHQSHVAGSNAQSNPHGPSIITVKSEEDAFRDSPNIDGSKQYYLNENGKAFYVKWFDANVPKTYRQVYKLVDDVEQTESPPEAKAEVAIAPAITELSEKVSAIEESVGDIMDEVKEILKFVRKTTKKEVVKDDKQ